MSFAFVELTESIISYTASSFCHVTRSLGFLFGIIVCSIMMSVVRGAVNTLIVCWADSPSRLEANHPEATKEMAETWSAVFPAARVNLSSAMSFPVGSPVEIARNS